MNAGDLIAYLKLNADAFNQGMAKASQQSESFTSKVGSIFGGLTKVLATTATAVTGVGFVLGGMAIKNAAQFEKYEAALTVMLGSAEKAKDRLKELTDFAKKTPFELPQVVELGNQLQALGRYSQENMTILGDLASAAGKPIDQVSGAFAKLVSGQKGVAIDMFRDLLITTEDWSKATGKGISKTGELMATTEEMIAALPKIMDSKKFTGMMEVQSETFLGKLSNMFDAFNQKLTQLGQAILPYLKPIIDQIITLISSIDVEALINGVKEAFKKLQVFVTPIFEWLQKNVLEPFMNFMKNNWQPVLAGVIAIVVASFVAWAISAGSAALATLVALAPVILVLGAIGLAVGVFYKAWTENWGGIQEKVQPIIEAIKTFIEDLVVKIQDFGTALGEFINSEPVQSFLAIMGEIATNIIANLKLAFESLVATFNEQILPALQNLWNALQPVFAVAFPILGAIIGVIIIIIGKLFEILSAVLKPAFEVIGTVIGVVINIIAEIIKWIVKLVEGIVAFVKDAIARWNEFKARVEFVFAVIKAVVEAVIEGIRKFIQDKIDWIKNAWNVITGAVSAVFNGIKSIIEGIFNGLVGTIKNVINTIIDLINKAIGWINGKIRDVNSISSNIGITLGEIGTLPRLAQGTSDAKGGTTLVGENGPELMNVPENSTVSPAYKTKKLFDFFEKFNGMFGGMGGSLVNMGDLSRSSNQSTNNPTININLDGANISSIDVANEYAEAIGDSIIEKLLINRRAYGN